MMFTSAARNADAEASSSALVTAGDGAGVAMGMDVTTGVDTEIIFFTGDTTFFGADASDVDDATCSRLGSTMVGTVV